MYTSVNWVSIGSSNGLSSDGHQAITWTNNDSLSIGPLGTNLSGIQIEIQNFLFKKMHLKRCLQNGGHFVQGKMS